MSDKNQKFDKDKIVNAVVSIEIPKTRAFPELKIDPKADFNAAPVDPV